MKQTKSTCQPYVLFSYTTQIGFNMFQQVFISNNYEHLYIETTFFFIDTYVCLKLFLCHHKFHLLTLIIWNIYIDTHGGIILEKKIICSLYSCRGFHQFLFASIILLWVPKFLNKISSYPTRLRSKHNSLVLVFWRIWKLNLGFYFGFISTNWTSYVVSFSDYFCMIHYSYL